MASTIRYDFSFPPKSSSLNANTFQFNNNHSICTNCNTNNGHLIHNNNNKLNINHNNNCILMKPAMSCTTSSSSSSSSYMHPGINVLANNYVHHTTNLGTMLLQQQAHFGGLQTPKDANCSFTFDELRNTLSFMDDSPLLVSQHATSMTKGQTTMLMVEPSSSDYGTAQSLSSASSTSSGSSSSVTSGDSSIASDCKSCKTNSLITKSNSASHLEFLAKSQQSSTDQTNCRCATKSNPPDGLSNNESKKTLTTNENPRPRVPQSNSLNSISLMAAQAAIIPVASIRHQHQHSVENGFVNTEVEIAAKKYRCAAQVSEASCAWKGKLPPKQYKIPIVYSKKVFVGGLPWDITEEDLTKEFGQFGPCHVEWTNKEKFNLSSNGQQASNQYRNYRSMSNLNQRTTQTTSESLSASKQRSSPGFAYVIYDNEYSVRSLVGNCIEDYANGRDRVEFYFKISTRRVRNKEVQIIPWILADNNYALCTPKELDPKKTVFVGNLHGTMTARDLAHIMNELFGCVVYAGIDIDKLKYPIGSGRVTFSHQQNFMRAVRAAFVDIQASKFSKRIQIDPYLEDLQCCVCYMEKGIYFCRDLQCFNYYCGSCWPKEHSNDLMDNHKPLMRKREDK